jgi:hypothetical protein
MLIKPEYILFFYLLAVEIPPSPQAGGYMQAWEIN